MSTKDFHTTRLYANHLRSMGQKYGRAVSAGELAKYAGVARATAKRYLDKAVKSGWAHTIITEARNGTMATGYIFGEGE